MPYIITEKCLGERYATCVSVCPVDCIKPGDYQGEEFMIICEETDARGAMLLGSHLAGKTACALADAFAPASTAHADDLALQVLFELAAGRRGHG